jgi:Na+-driven multidrug efflux pump
VLAVRAGWGPQGVFTAIPVAELALACASLWLFRMGKWKQQAI